MREIPVSYTHLDPAYVPDVNNSAYIIFMLIAIVGYFTIPTVSTWVIQASGADVYKRQEREERIGSLIELHLAAYRKRKQPDSEPAEEPIPDTFSIRDIV